MKFFSIRSITRGGLALIAALTLVSCGGDGNGGIPATTSASTLTAAGELGKAFGATLTGAQEVPPTPSNAQGSGTVVVNPTTREMAATVTTTGLTGTSAHIHLAPPGAPGPIIFPLSETSPGSGVWTTTATLTEDQFNNLQAGNFYFNVHSAAFPEGEIRGQIVSQQIGGTNGNAGAGAGTTGTGTAATGSGAAPNNASTTSFLAALEGQQEVPPTPSTAQGAGAVVIDPATRELLAAVTTFGITGTATHIHEGAPGVNGPIIIPLNASGSENNVWIARTTLTEAQYNSFLAGNLYFNVHSEAFPNGEIRGQISPQQQLTAGQTGANGTISSPGTSGSGMTSGY